MAQPAAPETGVILRVRLPRRLEELRQKGMQQAGRGLPAHVTLLYPFVATERLERRHRTTIAAIVATHAQFSFRLTGPSTWPQVLYASVEPSGPFRSIQADLAAAFPEFPIYEGEFDFMPHVTVAEGAAASLPEFANDPAWRLLPTTLTARSVDLLARDAEGWRRDWRFALRAAVRVLVCGERLRGDDAAALLGVSRVPARVRALADIVEVGQLTVEALLDVPEGVAPIVVDAAVGVAPGEVVRMPLSEVAGRGGGGAAPASSHSLPPDQVVALAEELRGSPLDGTFIGIGGAEFGHAEGLSPKVEAGLSAFAAALGGEIDRLAAI